MGNDLSIWTLVLDASPIVQAVMALLMVAGARARLVRAGSHCCRVLAGAVHHGKGSVGQCHWGGEPPPNLETPPARQVFRLRPAGGNSGLAPQADRFVPFAHWAQRPRMRVRTA